MVSRLNPYLGFRSHGREAMEFYRAAFGGKLEITPYGDMASDPADKDKMMHAMLVAPNGFTLMGSEFPPGVEHIPGNAMSVSLSGDDAAELSGYWSKLSAGAEITQPLEKAPWGDSFGMLTDQFGVRWMVNIAGAKS